MTDYRRIYIPGATWFFTVNLAERRNNHLLVEKIDLLRAAFRYVKERRPFQVNAVRSSCRIISIASGHCLRKTVIFRLAGICSKGIFPVPSRKASACRKDVANGGNAVYGNAGFGRI
jgi:hypothetical protein